MPLGPVAKRTRGRVQILLTDKTETSKLGIQLEPILPQCSRNDKKDDTSCSLTDIRDPRHLNFFAFTHNGVAGPCPYPYIRWPRRSGSDWDLRLLREHRETLELDFVPPARLRLVMLLCHLN